MRARPLLLTFLTLALAGCVRPSDAMAPIVGIITPKAGAVTQGQAVTVEGYAFDDNGITSVTARVVVDGRASEHEVLPESERGKRVVHYRFQIQAEQVGNFELQIIATDTTGQTRTLSMPLVLDNRPPRLELERVERVDENRIRIVGTAQDDVEVDRVVVHYGKVFSRLNLPKGKNVSFFVEVPATTATVIAVDAVGNRAELPATPKP